MAGVSVEQENWQATACNLCYANCGILVKTDNDSKSIVKVSDKEHPLPEAIFATRRFRSTITRIARILRSFKTQPDTFMLEGMAISDSCKNGSYSREQWGDKISATARRAR